MKRFQFRLEVVKRVRKSEMEAQAKAFALAVQAVHRAKLEAEDIKRAGQQEVIRVRQLTQQGLFTQQMLELSISYREELKRKYQNKLKEIRNLEQKAEQERTKLIEKEKRKKVIEKLEEKELEHYEAELKKQETKELDEIASIRFGWSPDK